MDGWMLLFCFRCKDVHVIGHKRKKKGDMLLHCTGFSILSYPIRSDPCMLCMLCATCSAVQ